MLGWMRILLLVVALWFGAPSVAVAHTSDDYAAPVATSQSPAVRAAELPQSQPSIVLEGSVQRLADEFVVVRHAPPRAPLSGTLPCCCLSLPTCAPSGSTGGAFLGGGPLVWDLAAILRSAKMTRPPADQLHDGAPLVRLDRPPKA